MAGLAEQPLYNPVGNSWKHLLSSSIGVWSTAVQLLLILLLTAK